MSDNVVPINSGISVSGFRRIDKGAVLAAVDLNIAAWHLVISCLWCKTDKAEWIALPSQAYTDRNGKKVYKPLVSIPDKPIYDRFQTAALVAVKRAANPDNIAAPRNSRGHQDRFPSQAG